MKGSTGVLRSFYGREADLECGAVAHPAVDPDRAALGLDVGADEVESKAQAARSSTLIATVKAIENPGQVLL